MVILEQEPATPDPIRKESGKARAIHSTPALLVLSCLCAFVAKKFSTSNAERFPGRACRSIPMEAIKRHKSPPIQLSKLAEKKFQGEGDLGFSLFLRHKI
jgi:hypothetical protein